VKQIYLISFYFVYSKLLQEPQVIFAGYKIPHPLEHNVIIRVQTTNETKPEAMVAKALNDLITEVGYLRTKFMVLQ
jgi:DNA-directed RNA polymerase II subunit RPB11